jgi:hypothetical protein
MNAYLMQRERLLHEECTGFIAVGQHVKFQYNIDHIHRLHPSCQLNGKNHKGPEKAKPHAQGLKAPERVISKASPASYYLLFALSMQSKDSPMFIPTTQTSLLYIGHSRLFQMYTWDSQLLSSENDRTGTF